MRGVEEVAAGALSMAQLARLGKLIPSDSCVAEFGPRGFFCRVSSPVGLQLFPKLTTVLFVP